ncbi:transporter substrate-binding domain-containing protein [Actinomadura sp. NAK00032]|uniref:transporter substrate-binding domain-containing protein n=1 Tax=Actinomadura sp. NAK00032 TaxID=2742128 RepID=UPI00158FB9A9|nr:transporter substrate-binding domain-containing protein [Actinomadura sp. NAK00032]QKW32732.1 transporter substrate-binding domain-containing protein [Actinomadura sp. NAK00032]
MRRLIAAWTAAVATACAALGGCGDGEAATILGKGTLVAGVRPDLPGIGFRRPDGTFEGLDVDVSRYLARRLGKRVRFAPALARDRERLLREGNVDMVLTFWLEPEWKQRLAFAGPYLLSYQDILVRDTEKAVRGVRDLQGRKICAVTGSGAAEAVTVERQVPAVPVAARSYADCMTMLRDGRIDAITTNDTILAGLKTREGAGFRLLNARFGERRTGIAIRKGDPEGCEALNRAITQMYQDGAMEKFMSRWFATSGLDLSDLEVPQFEGCL